MADKLTPAARSALMARIRSTGTLPELRLAAACEQIFGSEAITLNDRTIPGRPDVFVPALSIAIFADGCFYHCCPDHFRLPKTNRRYWKAKLLRNTRRDRRLELALRRSGISVWRVWEHDLNGRANNSVQVDILLRRRLMRWRRRRDAMRDPTRRAS